eukprot:CAMPEP_0194510198 /NCGR_PEP_ID=MMETSP0253-20130528/41456_1 /TAXON_ID=2966 /ORGANISM="Noctiluca scintillans" /LENGTH=285 /DNA_ID=CAMNT_0039353419 /DNA_START=47 /DNA_END=904 /DNA_ORIENTATION=+
MMGRSSVGRVAFEVQDLESESASRTSEDKNGKTERRWISFRKESLAALTVGTLVTVMLVLWRTQGVTASRLTQSTAFEGPRDVRNPNDLWALHDLLMLGFKAPFMKPYSEGYRVAQSSAVELARLMPALHPHPPCRAAFAELLHTQPGQMSTLDVDEPLLLQLADASWSCLPVSLTSSSFDTPFMSEAMHDDAVAFAARSPQLKDESVLGVCRGSAWPRTCSYWTAFHAFAYRAEALNLGVELFRAVSVVLAAGATQCGGCTLHWRLMLGPQLISSVQSDLGELS